MNPLLFINDEKHRAWENLQAPDTPPEKEDLAKWEAEFSQMMNAQRESLDYDYGESMQQAWESGASDLQDDGVRESMKFDEDGLPILGPYEFGKISRPSCHFTAYLTSDSYRDSSGQQITRSANFKPLIPQ